MKCRPKQFSVWFDFFFLLYHKVQYSRFRKTLVSAKIRKNELTASYLQGWERLRIKNQYINSTPKITDSTEPTVQTVH